MNLPKFFGDCFISGFIEGGELDTIVSIKTTDESSKKGITATLETNFGKGGTGVVSRKTNGHSLERTMACFVKVIGFYYKREESSSLTEALHRLDEYCWNPH